ncbi:hypothetical protein T06_12687, partial [Trichinella sp. T6]
MDEWLIRKPVKREVAEMESQKGSTADESMRPNKLLRHIETKHMDLKIKPLQFFESKLSVYMHAIVPTW